MQNRIHSVTSLAGPCNRSLSTRSRVRLDPSMGRALPASHRGVPRINNVAFELTKSSHDPSRVLNARIVGTFVGRVQLTLNAVASVGCTHPTISRVIAADEDYERSAMVRDSPFKAKRAWPIDDRKGAGYQAGPAGGVSARPSPRGRLNRPDR